MRITNLEVNIENFTKNINNIQNYIGNNVEIMPVLKANGYGTYINKNSEVINKFNMVAVAILQEAYELVENGYKNNIFVLNQPHLDEMDEYNYSKIIFGVCDLDFIKKLNDLNQNIRIHLEIDTGMGRTGIKVNEFLDFCYKLKKYSNVVVEGIYTHLSSADFDEEYTKKQLADFEKCIGIAKKEFPNLKYIHAAASNGILNYRNSHYNLVRPGIIAYGYESFEGTKSKILLEPVCKLKSKVTFLKEVDVNTSIGYSRNFITKKKSKIATIPIGYADGLSRALSNKGYVVINGQKALIIGNVCMDNIMVDVTDIKDVIVGDDVYIWDNDLVTVEDIAKKIDTINYEVISSISNRVPRIFV